MAKQYVITSAKILSSSEETHLRAVLRRGFQRGLEEVRNSLLFTLLLDLGPRIQELLDVRVRDFNPSQGSLFIRALKGSNDREMPVDKPLAGRLKNFILKLFNATHWAAIDPDAKIFDITYTRAYQLWQIYSPNKDKTMHSMRHTFAVNLYTKTKDIRLVQLALGHKNILNTLVYLDFVYRQSTMRQLMYG